MKDRDPLSRFSSRRISQAVEGGPAFDAMFTESRLIPTTWGNLASQLVERGIVGPTPSATCDFLGIDQKQLGDPRVIFTNPQEFAEFYTRLATRWEDKYRKAHSQAGKGFADYINSASESWKVEDGKEKASAVQSEIDPLGPQLKTVRDERAFTELSQRIELLRLKRDAFSSGQAVGLNEFVQTVWTYEGEALFNDGELAGAVESMMYDLQIGYLYSGLDVPTSEIVLGRKQINEFKSMLRDTFVARVSRHVKGRWNEIEPLLTAQPYSEHPLFAGYEK